MNAHHLNGVASRHSNRVEEEVIPDSPNSSPGMPVALLGVPTLKYSCVLKHVGPGFELELRTCGLVLMRINV